MPAARVLAQAKINVWLQVIGPRPDGYHEIFTLFQRLELADDIIIRASDEPRRSLRVTGARVPPSGLGPVEENLAYRAASQFQAHAGWPRGFEIDLVKNIPVGAGLGGGSADAGAVLRALNAMSPRTLDADTIQSIGRALGADVPFFASDYVTALGAGRGDVLRAMPFGEPPLSPPAAAVIVLVPPFAIATADAYGWLRQEQAYDRPTPFPAVEKSPSTASLWAALDYGNSFEAVIERRFPLIGEYRQRLSSHGAVVSRLSGSGSAVFGIFESEVPDAASLGVDGIVIHTRTAASVVQVEVVE